MIFDDNMQSGIPPPGWTLPPQKKTFFIFLEKFGCLKNEENRSLLDVPYKEPKYEFVFLSKSAGL